MDEKKTSKESSNTIKLMRIGGIRISLDYSWFIIFFLVLWSLSAGYFPYYFPGQPAGYYWGIGFIATFFFFSSIIVHELSHSFVAMHAGIEISEITLFIFGGVSRISQEAKDPGTEFRIAIAGPLSSFVLAGLFWGIRAAFTGLPMLAAVFGYLTLINLLLGTFNLVPGFPLDGGRVLRSLLWWRTGSVTRATKIASDTGKLFGLMLMIFGVLRLFSGALIGGLWLFFIGLFLRGIASREYQELMIRQSIEGTHVREIMMHDVVTVPPDLPLSRLVSEYFIKFCYRGFPVTNGGKVHGIVNLARVKDVPEEARDEVTVRDVMSSLDETISISPEASLTEALNKMTMNNTGRLIVTENGDMIGMVTRAGLYRFLEIKNILKKA